MNVMDIIICGVPVFDQFGEFTYTRWYNLIPTTPHLLYDLCNGNILFYLQPLNNR